ncbi:MAG: hypothetical protein IJR14_09395 [Synergistaceae bacterium]|nr:hypothetical protein [Synergistaceae bacterium]
MGTHDRIIVAFYAPYHGAGKTTAAGILDGIIGASDTHRPAYHARDAIAFTTIRSFAGPIRSWTAELMMLLGPRSAVSSERQRDKDAPVPELGGATERDIMIALGNAVRDVHPSIWADVMWRRFQSSPRLDFIIDDLRFPHEWGMLKSEGAKLVRVTVPGRPIIEAESEALLEDREFDYELVNTMDGLAKLTDSLERMAASFWPDRLRLAGRSIRSDPKRSLSRS